MSVSIRCDECGFPVNAGDKCYCEECYTDRTILRSEIRDIVYDLKNMIPSSQELRLRQEFEKLGITVLT